MILVVSVWVPIYTPYLALPEASCSFTPAVDLVFLLVFFSGTFLACFGSNPTFPPPPFTAFHPIGTRHSFAFFFFFCVGEVLEQARNRIVCLLGGFTPKTWDPVSLLVTTWLFTKTTEKNEN